MFGFNSFNNNNNYASYGGGTTTVYWDQPLKIRPRSNNQQIRSTSINNEKIAQMISPWARADNNISGSSTWSSSSSSSNCGRLGEIRQADLSLGAFRSQR